MRSYFLILMLFASYVTAGETKSESDETKPLMGLTNFKVVTLFPFFEKVDQKMISNSMVDSFKRFGQVTLSEKKSVFQELIQLDSRDPICFFTINKAAKEIEVSLEVLCEVEIIENKQKTICPIWKKNLVSPISHETEKSDKDIASLAQDMIKSLGDAWRRANPTGSSQPTFSF